MTSPQTSVPHKSSTFRCSLRECLGLLTIAILAFALLRSAMNLRAVETELQHLKDKNGYLSVTQPDQIAATRLPADTPLSYQFRVRTPTSKNKFRVAYSSVWSAGESGPQWFGAVPITAGDSLVTIRVMEDPRDHRWKIAAVAANETQTQRMATALPPPHVVVFRGSHQVISTGIPRTGTHVASSNGTLRLLDEKWLVGESALLLYGSRPPPNDQIGIYAELQPDVGSL